MNKKEIEAYNLWVSETIKDFHTKIEAIIKYERTRVIPQRGQQWPLFWNDDKQKWYLQWLICVKKFLYDY